MLKAMLLSIPLVMGGCFTAAGAVIGGVNSNAKTQAGEDSNYAASVVTGAALGAMLDAVLIVAAVSAVDNSVDFGNHSSNENWYCPASCAGY